MFTKQVTRLQTPALFYRVIVCVCACVWGYWNELCSPAMEVMLTEWKYSVHAVHRRKVTRAFLGAKKCRFTKYFQGTFAIMKIEYLEEKKSQKVMFVTSVVKGKNIYCRHGFSFPWISLEEEQPKHMGWICKSLKRYLCLYQEYTKTTI